MKKLNIVAMVDLDVLEFRKWYVKATKNSSLTLCFYVTDVDYNGTSFDVVGVKKASGNKTLFK